MKYSIVVLTLASLLTSCCRQRIHTSVRYEVRDSTVVSTQTRYIDTTLHIDSSVSYVKIVCDSNHQPQIISNIQTHGKSKVELSKIGNSTFKIKCPADSLRLHIAYQDSLIQMYQSKLTEITTVVEKKKTFWQSLGMLVKHITYIALTSILSIVLYILIRR